MAALKMGNTPWPKRQTLQAQDAVPTFEMINPRFIQRLKNSCDKRVLPDGFFCPRNNEFFVRIRLERAGKLSLNGLTC